MSKVFKNQEGFIINLSLLALAVLVLIGATIYAGYKDHHKSSAVAKPTLSSVSKKPVSSSAKTTPVPSQYAGWQTYTSKSAGYTIYYPASWTIEGYSQNGSSLESASQLTGNENSILLHYPDSRTNSFGIWIDTETKYETTTSASGSGFGPLDYPDGAIIKTLPNSMNIWEQTEQNAATQQAGAGDIQPDFEIVTDGQFGYKLNDDKYIQISMGYGYAFGVSTDYTYAEQSDSVQLQQAESILSSLARN